MDGKQLKNSILQWAIQGKLVEQNPKDEPASKLLERIAESRNESSLSLPKGTAKGTKSKDLKKKTSKNPPSRIYRENGVWYEQVGTATPKDITDEIPFEIPESWVWTNINSIARIVTDGEHLTPQRVDSFQGFYLLSARNILDGKISLDSVDYVDQSEYNRIANRCNPSRNDILISCSGSVGRVAVVNDDNCYVMVRSAAMIRVVELDSYYLMYALQSPCLQEQIQSKSKQTAQANLFQAAIRSLFIPIPPLAEQKRIVAKLEQVLPLAEEYGTAQEQLDKLNKELPETLKKSILQEAIQGKLVPQNSKDEPAQKLLEKIRKEKQDLVKQGVLKKNSLEDIPIDEDGKIFDIPESWAWCNLSMIAETMLGKTKSPQKDKGKPQPYLCSINVYWEGIRLDTVKEMPFSDSEKVKYSVRKGDLLICEGGECGRAAIWEKDDEIFYQNALHRVRFYKGIDAHYFKWCLYLYKNAGWLNEHIKGETIKHLVQNELDSIVFPLPPLAEQKRIVTKLEQLFKVL